MPGKDQTDRLVTWFQKPLPLPRVPTRLPDGSFDMEFPSEASREEQQEFCKDKVTHNCLTGARMACSVQALKVCRPSWIASFLGKEKAKLECAMHAKSFCRRIFEAPK